MLEVNSINIRGTIENVVYLCRMASSHVLNTYASFEIFFFLFGYLFLYYVQTGIFIESIFVYLNTII